MKIANIKKYLLSLFIAFVTLPIHAIDVNKLSLGEGFAISIFAEGLDSPRQMVEGSNGTIFVAERGGQIIALKDSDNNGLADQKILILDGLTFSTGLSLFDGDLYFSEISKIWKIEDIEDWIQGYSTSSDSPQKILVVENLPDDEWHGWKWLMHDKEGNLYFNVGAPCNICLSDNPQYATILKLRDGQIEFVAKGVRNSVGFDFHPLNNKLFFTDNGRDWLGDDSPSCELNRLDQEGQFFGYPYKHAFNVLDPEFGTLSSGYTFVDPIYELGAHVAPTGIDFYDGEMFPETMSNNLFIALHGSWNRSEKVGYKIVRVDLDISGNVIGSHDFITGWLQDEKVIGRPSAPLVLNDGSMLISDDKANVILRVTYSQ